MAIVRVMDAISDLVGISLQGLGKEQKGVRKVRRMKE